MKKIFTLSVLIIFVVLSHNVFGQSNNLKFLPGFSVGDMKVDAKSGSISLDQDNKIIVKGSSDGYAVSSGIAGVGAEGMVINGTVNGDVSTQAGGLTNTITYKITPTIADIGTGVGSFSEGYATTNAEADIEVSGLIGNANANMFGLAKEVTVNNSNVKESIFFKSNGFTTGMAEQKSVGGFIGDANINTLLGTANAEMNASITLNGYSQSDSYRFINSDENSLTEGMGSNIFAGTNVNTTFDSESYSSKGCLNYSNTDIKGGYLASGNGTLTTIQNAPGIGGAEAFATGSYDGVGKLGTNFNGNMTGYNVTTTTTFTGMNGTINTASSGMNVSSIISR